MAEKTLNVHTVDGEMETFIAHPDGNESNPVVVVYMDAPGIREELYDFARRIAPRATTLSSPTSTIDAGTYASTSRK